MIQANIMKNFGINIVAIAVGRDVPLDELRKMATNPTDVELILYNNFGRQANDIRRLQQKLCPVPSEQSIQY